MGEGMGAGMTVNYCSNETIKFVIVFSSVTPVHKLSA